MYCGYYLDAARHAGHFSPVRMLLIMAYVLCLGSTTPNSSSGVETQVTFSFGVCTYLDYGRWEFLDYPP